MINMIIIIQLRQNLRNFLVNLELVKSCTLQ